MLLYLIRHGESIFNGEGRIQGQADVGLSELGKRQSQAIAQGLASVKLDAIYSSPLQRAYQTALPLAESQGRSIEVVDNLKEINAGIFQGLLWSEIEAKYPEYAEPWLTEQVDFVIPQGESRQQLLHRGVAALEFVCRQPQKCVAVVAHGGLLCAALKGLLGIQSDKNPFSLFNASISRLVWDDRWRLLTLNQTEHLTANGVANEAGRGNL